MDCIRLQRRTDCLFFYRLLVRRRPVGGCRIPEAWKVYYKNEAGAWVPVKNTADYPIQKDAPCTVEFEPVKTAAVKLEVQLPEDNAAGIFEWEVK